MQEAYNSLVDSAKSRNNKNSSGVRQLLEHKEGLLNNKQPKEIIDNNNKSNENNVDISKSNSEIQNEASIQNVKVDNNTNKINQIISCPVPSSYNIDYQ